MKGCDGAWDFFKGTFDFCIAKVSLETLDKGSNLCLSWDGKTVSKKHPKLKFLILLNAKRSFCFQGNIGQRPYII